jgi:hypothetical protein
MDAKGMRSGCHCLFWPKESAEGSMECFRELYEQAIAYDGENRHGDILAPHADAASRISRRPATLTA